MAIEKNEAGKITVIEVQGSATLKRLEVGRGRTGTRVISAGEDGAEVAASFPSKADALRTNGLVLKVEESATIAVPGTPKAKVVKPKSVKTKGVKAKKAKAKKGAKKAPAKKATPVQQAA